MRNYTTKWHLNIFCNRYVFYISLLLEYGKISVLYKFFHFVYVSMYKCILCIIQHTLLVILVNTIMTSQKLLYLELTKYSVWPIWKYSNTWAVHLKIEYSEISCVFCIKLHVWQAKNDVITSAMWSGINNQDTFCKQ